MPSSPKPTERGFTLIEILVVVVSLGLLATVAVSGLGGSSQRRELDQRVRELFLVFQVAGERAILDNGEIGVQIADNRVRYLRYIPAEQNWDVYDQKPFRSEEWDQAFFLELETETDPPRMRTSESNAERPDLVFFSSGETTPFRISIGLTEDPDRRYRIETDGLNPMQLLQPDEEDEVRLQ